MKHPRSLSTVAPSYRVASSTSGSINATLTARRNRGDENRVEVEARLMCAEMIPGRVDAPRPSRVFQNRR